MCGGGFSWCLPNLMNGSLRFDAGKLNHLAPFRSLFGHELSKVGRRASQHSAPEVGDPGLYVLVDESRADLLVEFFNNLGWRILGGTNSKPRTGFVARNKIAHG